MPALPSLTVLPAEPLCRAADHTCAACCWGDRLTRQQLTRRLRRQTRWFVRFTRSRQLSRWRLLLCELFARRGLGLFWGFLLWVPLLNEGLRGWLKQRTCCAFLGFEDQAETRVACLLHPTRWQGQDVRSRAAFALLRGFGCGPATYYCLFAWRFARGPWRGRRRLLQRATGLDWFTFSQLVARGYDEPETTDAPDAHDRGMHSCQRPGSTA